MKKQNGAASQQGDEQTEEVVVQQHPEQDLWEDKYRRAAADYYNLEQRVSRQIQEAQERGRERILVKLLVVLDDMKQAEKFVTDPGLQLVKAKFEQVLHEEGVEELDVMGKPFDPQTAECIQVVDGDEGIVIEVHQAGYMLGNRLVRPAKVSVGKEKS